MSIAETIELLAHYLITNNQTSTLDYKGHDQVINSGNSTHIFDWV